jgi:hypothetical protein
MQGLRLFDFGYARDLSLGRRSATAEDLLSLVAVVKKIQRDVVDFAIASVHLRAAMSLLPVIPESYGFNQRKTLVECFFLSKGLIEGEDFSADDVESVIQICNRITDFEKHYSKSSWSHLHYSKKHALLLACNRRCAVCGVVLDLTGNPDAMSRPEVDHIIPFIFAGNRPQNLRVICRSCNLSKGRDIGPTSDATVSQNLFFKRLAERRLDYWVFERDRSTCTSVGCGNTSLTVQLHTEKLCAAGRAVFDNLRTVCELCAH